MSTWGPILLAVPSASSAIYTYQHGPDGGVPLVLLHCFWATSAMWVDHVSVGPSNTGCLAITPVWRTRIEP